MTCITDSHKKARAILNSQARTGHVKLMQLIRKYPVMQSLRERRLQEVHNSKPGSNHAPETQNGVSNHQTTTTTRREDPGARGPRSLSSIMFQTPGVFIDATPVRIQRTRRQDPYQTAKKKLGTNVIKQRFRRCAASASPPRRSGNGCPRRSLDRYGNTRPSPFCPATGLRADLPACMRCERGTLLPLLPSKPTVQHTQHLLVKILATVTEICTHEPAPDELTPTSFNAVETL